MTLSDSYIAVFLQKSGFCGFYASSPRDPARFPR